MGMSASQARLLSITSRLTNNEFRSQTITNSKLRLATASQEASQNYMDVLNSKQLMFMNYDDNGAASKVELTPAVLYDYAPMKNQYMLTNSAGKYIVSNTDAKNFEDSKDLFTFLKKYDLAYDITNYANEKIQEDWQKMRDNLYADYERRHAEWEEISNNWTGTIINTELYEKCKNAIGTSQLPKDGCYGSGLNGNVGCYLHLLNKILDFDGTSPYTPHEYTTSWKDPTTGEYEKYVQGSNNSYYTRLYHSENWSELAELSAAINDEDKYKCDHSDKFTPDYVNDGVNDKLEWDDEDNILVQAINDDGSVSGRSPANIPTKYEILRSDYIYDPENNKVAGIKSIKQKAIDLYYLIQFKDDFPEIDVNVMREMLINFTEGDLKMRVPVDPPEEPQWTEPDPPKLKDGITFIRDQEKSQWYTNLWHAMNGSDTSNTVDLINFDNDVEDYDKIPADQRSEYRFIVENATKDTKQTNYEILDSNLNKSPEWLKFALEHGIITLQQAQYYNPDADSNKTENLRADGYKWKNIVYTSARDFVQQDNQKAIAIAEIKYKKAITEIEQKDQKFDQDLKKLDTEHSALQTEYDSIKEVLSKNIDRSFKAFS